MHMAKSTKHGLGRGLSALLGDAEAAKIDDQQQPGDAVLMIKITQIDPNQHQPRRKFAENALRELADSIASVGIIQPIIVSKVKDRYQIIAGERRWRAARLAGLFEMPAIVRDWDETKRLEVALIENLQRDDLNPIEQAMGIRGLMDQCGYTQEMAAERLGMSRPALANFLRLLSLPDSVRELLIDGLLSAGHGRALAALDDEARQVKLAGHAVSQGLSVRQLEKLVKELPKDLPTEPAHETTPRRDPAQIELEKMARDVFGTKAKLDGDSDKGKLILHYFSAEDLQRIWEILEMMNQGMQ